MKVNRPILLAAAAITIAVLAAYHNTFAVPILFDDEPSILFNPSITRLWPLWTPLSPPTGFGFTVSGRPLLNLTLAVNYAISGTNVWSYHALNLLIHLLAGLVLFGLVRRTLRRPSLVEKFGANSLFVALIVALLWTLHPLQTEAVTYIIQRAESLMGLFYLLTLYCFARSAESTRASFWQGCAIGSCALGMTCKEVMVTAPVVVLLFDRTFFSGNFRDAWKNRSWFYGGLAVTWLPLAWLVLQTGGNRGGTFVFTPSACLSYWLTQFEAVSHYLRLTFWPRPLIFEYGLVRVERVAEVLPAMVLVLSLLGATLWALRLRPVAGFLGACFFLILAPTSVLPGITQVIVEHRMYLSLAAVIAFAVGGAAIRFGRSAIVCGIALTVVAGVVTERRNTDYGSDLSLWRDTVQKRPSSAKAQSNLGTALFRRGEYAEALSCYSESLRLDPIAQTHFNLGLVLEKLGRTEEAIAQYYEALRILPYFGQAHAMLGKAFTKQRDFTKALMHLQAALGCLAETTETQHDFGVALAESGNLEQAVAAYEKALQQRPNYAEAESNLGAVLFRLNRKAEAIRHLERAIQLNPRLADAHYNLGLMLVSSDRRDNALIQYADAVRLDPNHTEAHINLGILLEQNGRVNEALVHLQEAVRLQPERPEAYANLGIALAAAGRTEEAVVTYEHALRLRPESANAHYNLGNALLQLQQWAKARDHFAEAVRIEPDFAAAKEILARMQTHPSLP